MAGIDKNALVNLALTQLQSQLQSAIAAAQLAHEGATHEQNRAETKYDTLGLEHAYLAHGQSKRIDDLQRAIVRLENWQAQHFAADADIYLGAIVELQGQASNPLRVFITPAGGGIKLPGEIQLLTPDTPLGQALLGLQVADHLTLGNGQRYTIINVC